MARRIAAAITRVLLENKTDTPVHIHSGPHGPYVCEAAGCTSPGLDPRDF